ncbi:type I restriction enzyme HsdR N-terminal domain-containing protein [Psychromonas sp. PT13]|uniref:type I restriction enzyme HsdR N-terminal domain-containing protein n=1 Tax=Psychromonas sp. PT13 TaxID=3439547 RepID=UPI003EB8EBF6
MQHKPFYTISENCYLFDRKLQPEEEVRQWVLFELIRYYGYSINQLEIEKTVQYGTRRGFIDILIYVNDKPYIVIECKRRKGYRKSQDPMKQAISYANADSIQAEFCVFTDGNIWQVKRNTAAGWVHYPNIPCIKEYENTELEFSQFLNDLDEVRPILHWLYQPIVGRDVLYFIDAIQPIFNAQSIVTSGTNSILLDIIDHVCRGITIKSELNVYHYGKLEIAYQKTQFYLKKLGMRNFYKDVMENDLHELLMMPDVQFNRLKETIEDYDSEMDHAAIHLLSALYSVARTVTAHKSEKQLSLNSAFTDELFNFINLGLQRNLQIGLPSKSDTILVNYIQESCETNWQAHLDSRSMSVWELFKLPFYILKNKVFA